MIAAIDARKSTDRVDVPNERRKTRSRVNDSACLAALVAISALGCSTRAERDINDVTSFFAVGAKCGMSPDAGLYRYSDQRGQWDHVATFHSMADDVGLCESTARALQESPPLERYTCRLLNQ